MWIKIPERSVEDNFFPFIETVDGMRIAIQLSIELPHPHPAPDPEGFVYGWGQSSTSPYFKQAYNPLRTAGAYDWW
jgi:hypothetical protein